MEEKIFNELCKQYENDLKSFEYLWNKKIFDELCKQYENALKSAKYLWNKNF